MQVPYHPNIHFHQKKKKTTKNGFCHKSLPLKKNGDKMIISDYFNQQSIFSHYQPTQVL